MISSSRFFVVSKVAAGFLSALFSGISTAFLLSKGFSLLSISAAFSVSLVTSTVMEIPSGFIADRIGRKRAYALGVFCRALHVFLFWTATHSATLYLAAFSEGLYSALTSGSLEAWLKGSGENTDYPKVFGLSKMLSSLISTVSLFAIGFVFAFSLSDLFLAITVCYCIVAGITLLLLKDNKGSEGAISNGALLWFLLKQYVADKKMLFLTYVLSSTFAFISVYMLYFQPRAVHIGFAESALPFLSAISLLGNAVSGYVFSRFGKRFGNNIFVFVSFWGISLSFLGFALAPTRFVYAACNFIYGISIGGLIPIFFSWSLDVLSEDNIATNLSIMSGISTAIAAVTTLLVGFSVDSFGLNSAIAIGIFLCITCIGVLWGLQRST